MPYSAVPLVGCPVAALRSDSLGTHGTSHRLPVQSPKEAAWLSWLQFSNRTVEVTTNQEMVSLPAGSEPTSPGALVPLHPVPFWAWSLSAVPTGGSPGLEVAGGCLPS